MLRAVVVLGVVAAGSPAYARAPTCVVRGKSVTLAQIKVHPAGEPEFQLGIAEVPVAAVLPARCGAPLLLTIGGAVNFTATRDKVWLRLARDVTSSDGMITAQRGAQVIDACVQGDHVVASAVIYSDDVLEGEYKDAQRVRGFDIPCNALTLDMIADDSDADETAAAGPDDDTDDTDGTARYWQVPEDVEHITLRSQPKRNAAGHVLDSTHIRELKRTGDWVFVEAANEGVSIRGWAPVKQLERIPEHTGVGYGYGCHGDHGNGAWGEGGGGTTVEREGTIRIGTPIYAGNGTGLWGVFAKPTHVRIRISRGSVWADLRRVPGLDGDPSGSPWLNGSVRLDTVTLDPTP